MKTIEVEFCMGSSCFARGNAKSLEFLEAFIEANNLGERVSLSGNLCLGTCSQGPNIKIDGKLHTSVKPEYVVSLLQEALKEEPNNG
jgi:NADH:ubiquinone oxidoreductase subunit E